MKRDTRTTLLWEFQALETMGRKEIKFISTKIKENSMKSFSSDKLKSDATAKAIVSLLKLDMFA